MDEKTSKRIGNNKSPIIISENLFKDFKRWWQLKIGTHSKTPVLVFIDENVQSAHHPLIDSLLQSIPAKILEIRKIRGGESCKQLESANQILSEWIAMPVTKDAVLICIGGGATTDLGGFIASIYKRGLRTVFIPTSLMAMTDASLGGKNAINHSNAKNQIGTIHFPEFTLISPMFLQSLLAKEMKSGYAEIMKHAILDSTSFINQMSAVTYLEIAPNIQLLIRSIRVKMRIVVTDPEEHSSRLWLNLGHTFGHAYESYFTSIGIPISHGHAVAIGLAETIFCSVKLFGFPSAIADKTIKWLRSNYSFDNLPEWKNIQSYILKDKKNISSGIRLILMKSPGQPVIELTSESHCQALHQEFLAQL